MVIEHNQQEIVKKKINDNFSKVRELLEKSLGYVQRYEEGEYKRTPFSCDECKKDILGKFVKLDIFENMNDWYNNYVGGTLKVFHIECFNKLYKK